MKLTDYIHWSTAMVAALWSCSLQSELQSFKLTANEPPWTTKAKMWWAKDLIFHSSNKIFVEVPSLNPCRTCISNCKHVRYCVASLWQQFDHNLASYCGSVYQLINGPGIYLAVNLLFSNKDKVQLRPLGIWFMTKYLQSVWQIRILN